MTNLEMIKDFILTLSKECKYYTEGNNICDNCKISKFCEKMTWTDKEIEELYDIYMKSEFNCKEELKLAKEIKESGIPLYKIKQIIEILK